MKRFAAGVVWTAVAFLGVVARGQEQGIAITSRIDAVTVYPDRVRVFRLAAVGLAAGVTTYVFPKLPGWIDEESVRTALIPGAAGRIVDVQVKREYLARAGDANLRKAEAAVQEIADTMGAIEDELKVMDEKAKQVESIRAFSLDKLPKDMAVRDVDIATYGKVVNFVADTLREIAERRREAARKKRDLAPELAMRQKKLADIKQLTKLEETTVLVAVESTGAADASLSISYLLPGATWEPVHELRVAGANPKTVRVLSYAGVSQTTGEDWDGATLTFSTQSPTETVRIPELDAMLVGGGRAMPVPAGNDASFLKAKSKYAAQNTLWYNAYNPNEVEQAFFTLNLERQEVAEGRATQVARTVRERGTTAQFAGLARPPVRSDGRTIRVPIGEVEFECTQQIIAAPAISLNAARTVQLANTGGQPLLPGKVSLFQDGAFLGLTDVDFVAAGEPFALFLGVADQIKLSRMLDRKRSSISRGRRTRTQASFVLTVENLGGEETTIRLSDRVPVSENRDVDVRGVSIQPSSRPDSNGVVTWDLAIKPKDRKAFRVEYSVEYPGDFLERTVAKMQTGGEAAAQAAGQPQSDELVRQLKDLESKF